MKRNLIVLATALGVPLVLTGCAPAGDDAAETSAGFDLAAATIVDLSHGYGDNTLYWPTDQLGFRLDELAYGETDGGYFYSAYSFCTAEHGGTHLDAPIHFSESGVTLDHMDLRNLVAPAVVIDVSGAAAGNPDYLVSREEIEAWEADHGPVPAGAAVLLRTGWSEFWPDALSYLGDDTPGDASNLHFPSYGIGAARYLVEERAAGVLGIDTASIDGGTSTDFVVHQVAAAKQVAGLENLTNLDRLPATGAWLVALPIKIEGGSGGPVRAIALVP